MTTQPDPVSSELGRYSMSDPAVAACPHAYYAAMRRESPVHRDPGTGFYWVTRNDAVQAAATDLDDLSSNSSVILKKSFLPKAQALWDAAGMRAIDTLVTGDPPDHFDYRVVGNSLFPARKVTELVPAIERLVNQLIDDIIDRGEIEFVQDFASRLPGTIVCDEFGLPREDQPRFQSWINAVLGLMTPGISEEQEVALITQMIELFRYLQRHIEQVEHGPAGRVIHALATTPKRDGTPFSLLERCWMTGVTFIGGIASTISMLTSGVYRLAKDPALQYRLRAEPGLTLAFIEELLRLDGAVPAMLRVARRDIEIDGTLIPAGSNVVLSNASANRDETRWEAPDEFRLDRPDARRHIAFGHGTHSCIGMHLARREMQIAFDALLQRLDRIELAIPDDQIQRVPHPIFYAIARLPIRFVRRAE